MSKLLISLFIFSIFAISESIVYGQDDGRYHPVTTFATKKPLFPALGRYTPTVAPSQNPTPTPNVGKYNRHEFEGKIGKHFRNEDGQYHANSGNDGKYTKPNKRTNKPIKNIKSAVNNKAKLVARSNSFDSAANFRRNVIRATSNRGPTVLPPVLPTGRGTSGGGNDIQVLYFTNEPEIDSYHFAYGTENGISADEEGRIMELPTGEGIQTKGFYEYTGDDGVVYRVDYVSDDNGFVPQGAHIPPTPPHVVKLLEYLALNAKN